MSPRVDLAISDMARRIFGFHNFNSQVAGRELVGLLESAVVRRAEAQKAAAREWPYWIRGKIGYLRVVFYGVGSRQYARDYVVPRDPRTRHQARVRGRLGRVSAAWGRGLTEEQRVAWNAAAAKELSRRAPRGRLTGQTLFVRHNSVLELAGREWALWPPGRVVFGVNPVVGLRVGQRNPKAESRNPKSESRNPNGDEGWRVELEVAGPVEHDILIFGERPVGAGRRRVRHPVYLGVVPAGTGAGVLDLTEWYVGRLGTPGAGQRVFICAEQQRDGWRDRGKVLSEVVSAGVGAAGEGRGARGEGRSPKAEGGRDTEGQIARSLSAIGPGSAGGRCGLGGLESARGLGQSKTMREGQWFMAGRGRQAGMSKVRIECGAYVDGGTPICTGKRAEMGTFGRSGCPRAGAGGAGAGQGGVFSGRKGRRREWRGRWRGS